MGIASPEMRGGKVVAGDVKECTRAVAAFRFASSHATDENSILLMCRFAALLLPLSAYVARSVNFSLIIVSNL